MLCSAIRIQLRQMEIGVHGFIGYTGFMDNDIPCVTVAKNAAARNLPLFSASCTRAQLSEKKVRAKDFLYICVSFALTQHTKVYFTYFQWYLRIHPEPESK